MALGLITQVLNHEVLELDHEVLDALGSSYREVLELDHEVLDALGGSYNKVLSHKVLPDRAQQAKPSGLTGK